MRPRTLLRFAAVAGPLLTPAVLYLRTAETKPAAAGDQAPGSIFEDKALWSALAPGAEVMVAEADPTRGLEGQAPFETGGRLIGLPSGTRARVARRYLKGDEEVELLVLEGPLAGTSGKASRTNVRPLK